MVKEYGGHARAAAMAARRREVEEARRMIAALTDEEAKIALVTLAWDFPEEVLESLRHEGPKGGGR